MDNTYGYESSYQPHTPDYFLPYVETDPQQNQFPVADLANKYVFVRQNVLDPNPVHTKTVIPKVLVNPNFNKKVFVNPNFHVNNVLPSTSVPKIHVNPNVQKFSPNPDERTNINKIHVNPNILKNIPVSLSNTVNPEKCPEETYQHQKPIENISHRKTLLSTRTKLILSPVENKPRKRLSSVRSKFKIIKSSVFNNSSSNEIKKRRLSLQSKYKIVKSTHQVVNRPKNPTFNKFKLDNRKTNKIISPSKNKKYVYVNRFLSISDIAKNTLLKRNVNNNYLNISGVVYRKSPNCLKRTSEPLKKISKVKTPDNLFCKSKYKFVRRSLNNKLVGVTSGKVLKQSKVLRSSKLMKNISPGKLHKCNIPCPYYRKFGKCRGKDNGKCYRKHDPDQVALCTKFLQGACVDEKCLLSHNVSPEKMPTCKYYLEGSCSRDNCPYLHVRISPNADICRDFLKGFCKEASECDKRHQLLCPDYEKNGNCQKQRCPYPHGKMVRKYSVFNKNKFAKKSSKKDVTCPEKQKIDVLVDKDNLPSKTECLNNEINVKTRYYVEQNSFIQKAQCQEQNSDQKQCTDTTNDDGGSQIRSRPKLGKLPSFIAFEDI